MKKYPLSKTEYGIYVEQITRNDTAYNIPLLVTLPDNIDEDRLEQAVLAAVEAHPVLLTGFASDENGEVYKYRHEGTVSIERIDTDNFEPYDYIVPFDLHNDLLCRFFLVNTDTERFLFFDIHHIIFDGTSIAVLLDDISRAYRGESCLKESFTADEYALEEQERLSGDEYASARSYYLEAFGGVDVDSSLYTDKNEHEPGAVEMEYTFNSFDSDTLKKFAKDNGVKLSTVFNAAFAYLLSKHCGSEQALYSTVHHGRDERLIHSIGMFVKTYPVYADLSVDEEIGAFLKKLDTHIVLNRKNDLYSFADFCAELKLEPTVLFAYQGDLLGKLDFCGEKCQVELLPMKDAKSGFELTVRRYNGIFKAFALYDRSLYDDEVVASLCESFEKIISDMLKVNKLSEIDMLTPGQLSRLDALDHNDCDYDITDIVTMFRSQTEKTPDNTAVVYSDKSLSYRELDIITDRIASYLKGKGIGREDVVSVLIPRSEYMAVASLGVLKSGAGYQPLDPTYPEERLSFMVSDSGAKLLIADRALIGKLPDYSGEVLFTDDIDSLPEAAAALEAPSPADKFIMLYTSGSTGVPKGVVLEHRNLCCFCNWYRKFYSLNSDSRVAAYASYGFDADMMDLYPALTSGASVHIIGEDIRLDLLAIKDYFERNRITHSFMTTQVGRQYADLFPNAEYPRYLSVGGERLVPVAPPEGYRFFNAYGPTECTIFTNVFEVDMMYDRVPIGKPIDNLKQYVVDKNGRRLPVGVPGELIVAGHQVGKGYLNRPAQNEKAFIKNPFSDEEGYDRAYRTGDIVRMMSDGSIDFVGRNDGQVKIRGFRIELSEVEGVIRRFEGIKDATVQAFDDAGGGKFIAAYVVSDNTVDIEALNSFIRSEKPPYMVPAVTMQIDRIPLNQNQKVNKRALPVPEKQAEDLAPPENETQQLIFDIISDVIGSRTFGINTDIFEAGLTSIGAIKLNVLLSDKFDVPVTIKDLRSHSTVAAIERLLADTQPAVSYEIRDDYPITQTQNGIFVECAAAPGSTVYNIPYLFKLSDKLDLHRLKEAIEDALDAHPYVKTELFLNDSGDIRAKRNDSAQAVVDLIKASGLPDDLVQPFSLLNSRLYRAYIYQTDSGNYLFLEFHHIICDGTSEMILLEDINSAYSGEKPVTESYTGFEAALDEQRMRATDSYTKAKSYYDDIFSGIDADFLPNGDAGEKSERAAQLIVDSSLALTTIKNYCIESGVTENAFFNSVFAFVLAKYNYKTEAYYATIYNGRSDSRLSKSVAMLVKTLPVYCRLDGDTKIAELVAATGEQLMSSMTNDIYSFAELVHDHGLNADIMFAYQGDSFSFDCIGGEPAQAQALRLSDVKAPLNINIFVHNNNVQFACEFRGDLYTESFIRGFVACMETAAAEFTEKTLLREVNIMSDSARALIDSFNATEVDIEPATCNKLFERQVELNPDKTAVITGDESLTYSQLNSAANRIAHMLINEGVHPDDMIGVMTPRTVYAYAVREGILKSGGAFMPLAPDYPDDRISYILDNSSSRFVVTAKAIADDRRDLFNKAGVRVFTIEDMLLCKDDTDPDTYVKPYNLCYCIYTSGSTGKPKGVMIEHHSLVNFVDHNPLNAQSCEFCDNMTVSLALAALTFDVSVLEETLALYHGGTVAMATDDEINNPILLAEMIKRNGVDVMKCTPSYMDNMLDVPQAVEALCRMKAIDIGAEAFPAPLYNKMRAAGITAKIHNGYGPTEATITTSIDYLTSDEITIGKPLCNTKVVMLDKYDNELPANVPGELTVIGECVGRGYAANEKLTKEKFILFHGSPAYRSGDLARWGEDGKIRFMGRMDNQVKLRGLRIELDEIENVMNSYPSVNRSVVLVKDNESTGQYLCAYFTAKVRVDTADLAVHLGKSLAKYMVPSVFVQLDAIPMTKNGKVDKKALPEPQPAIEEHEYMAPQNELQQRLCDIFAYALGTDKVGINENFFEIGGTSLSASKIAMKAMTENIPIAFKDIFDYPTVEKMERYINSLSTGETVAEETVAADEDALSRNTEVYVDEVESVDIGDVLLTGATGYLGIHVLKCILDTTDKTVYCLLRNGRNPAETRLKQLLMYYFDDPFEELFGSRIHVIAGDVTDRDVVMSLDAYPFDTLINCAACVKHFVQDDTLERINWHGVENLVDLCVNAQRRLVQISTVSVAGTSVNNKFPPEKLIHENELYFGQCLDNKYANTKFKAEQAVLNAVSERGLDGKVIRVGNLMSRYSDGEFQINFLTNNFMRTLRAYAAIGKISVAALDCQVEFSPIDCTAAAVVRLAGVRGFTVFHATNGHRVQMGDVIEAINEIGVRIDTVPVDEFEKAFREALADEKLNETVSPLIAYQVSDKNTVEFYLGHDNSFTTKALYRLGFKWPIIDYHYLKNALNALKTFGFFEEE